MKMLIAVSLVLMLAGCATAPMDRTVLLEHATRNCRVEAAVNKAYAVTSTGIPDINVGFQRCMARHGFVASR